MKRTCVLVFVLLFAVAHACAPDSAAQSRRVRPKEERAEKSAPPENDGAKQDSQDKTQDEAQDNTGDGAQGGKADDAQPSKGDEVVVRARIKAKPDPVYPRGARRYGVEGTVKLRIILGADGKVREEMDVLEALPHGLTEAAIEAARRIEFEPARKGGRPVSQYVTVIYHFRIH